MIYLPEQFKIVQGIAPRVGAGGALTSDTVSLKNAVMAWIVVNIADSNGDALLLTPQQDVSVAAAASVVLVNTVPIWSNASTGVSDTLVAQTEALNFTTAATAVSKQVIFQIDPSGLTAGYDCINLLTGNVAATTGISVEFYLQTRYPQATPPAAITD